MVTSRKNSVEFYLVEPCHIPLDPFGRKAMSFSAKNLILQLTPEKRAIFHVTYPQLET